MQIELTANDEFLLLACDGLFDVMSHQEAVDFVISKLKLQLNPEEITKALVEEAFQKGSLDNITALLVTFKNYGEDSLAVPHSLLTPL